MSDRRIATCPHCGEQLSVAAPAAEPVPLTLDAERILTRIRRQLRHEPSMNGGRWVLPSGDVIARAIDEALAALARPEPSAQEDRPARDPESPADAALILAPDFTDYDDD